MESDCVYDCIHIPPKRLGGFPVFDDLVELVGGESNSPHKFFQIREINFDIAWKQQIGKRDGFGHPAERAAPHADSFSIQQHVCDVLLFVVEIPRPFADGLVERFRDVFRVDESFFFISIFGSNSSAGLAFCNDIVIGTLLVVYDEF